MRRFWYRRVCLALFALYAFASAGEAAEPASSWSQKTLADAGFSFEYAGARHAGRDSGGPATVPTQLPYGQADQFTLRLKEGLVVSRTTTSYTGFPAREYLLCLRNEGTTDTAIIENIDVLDLTLDCPMAKDHPYVLHKTAGAQSTADDFSAGTVVLDKSHAERMGGSFGRSSNSDLPFFKVETGQGSVIVAVGWTGRWRAELTCPDDQHLRITAGLQKARFRLHSGEAVRLPRILLLAQPGDTLDSNAQFRQLIYRHYACRREDVPPLPTIFCNTCFVAGGGWLGDANTADNQISLIRAFGPLGLEAVITDAGWMEGSQGGWYKGCGNWTPRKDNYPQGMAPVAAAAQHEGMVYGLWHEIETVVKGTALHTQHPDWLIDIGARSVADTPVCNVNFGSSQARKGMLKVVTGLMKSSGLRVYRQDFGLLDPSSHWDSLDSPDRQGIGEIQYITGMYEYWDGLRSEIPGVLLEGCAAGGRRIDLETISRMHIHQKTDFWFNNEVDQLSIWGLSQYLPNNCFVAHLDRLDDYSFHSTLASSLCVGWKADSPAFDSKRAGDLIARYKAVRHLLVGAWYPLTSYSRDMKHWLAVQYHRPDLDEGVVLVFRRPESTYAGIDLSLRSLRDDAVYWLRSDRQGDLPAQTGRQLAQRFTVEIKDRPGSDMIHYQRHTER
jgi:alpha-galactosidase